MIKILIVDDSAFMRQIFKNIIEEEKDLTIVGTAINGEQALTKIKELNPDVITLDIDMPIKNGFETLEEITSLEKPIPTIMISANDQRENVLKALELGAFDFIPKPSSPLTISINDIQKDLVRKIRAAANIEKQPKKYKPIKPLRKSTKTFKAIHQNKYPIVAIGTSSGGPKALKEVIPVFPADFPGTIVIVQHMPAGFTASLANRLDQESEISVKEAEEGDQIKPGLALIAPGGYHMELDHQGKVLLNQSPTKWGVRPCVDYLFTSTGKHFTNRVIGVVMTGMGRDGAEGMKVIKDNNGYGLVEDKSTALVYGMPGSVIKAEAYDEIIPLHQIPFTIIDLIERRF